MPVLETYIIAKDGQRPFRLYKCSEEIWYYEIYNFIGDLMGLSTCTPAQAQEWINKPR